MEHLILKWRSEPRHSLFINPYGEDGICALLFLWRHFSQNTIPIFLPQDIGLTIDVFEDAWEAQGEEWQTIQLFIAGMPVDANVLWLPMGSLIWVEFDVMGAPCDTCQFSPITKKDWGRQLIYGKAVFQAAS